MAQRINFSSLTNLGAVADPELDQDAATKAYVDTHSGGSTTLAGLADVAINEPTYVRFGTLTVTAVDGPPANTITVSVASTALLGAYIRGGTAVPGRLPSLEVIGVVGAVLSFASDPTTYFAVNDNIYFLPLSSDGNLLEFSNTQNRWIAARSKFDVASDILTWVYGGNTYVSDPTVATTTIEITTPSANLTDPWNFGLPTLALIRSPSVVIISDIFGRVATGTYTAGVSPNNATLSNVRYDRISGGAWSINTSYRVEVRQGVGQGGGSSSTLQSLTDVQIVEPTFSQVGSFAVTAVSTVAPFSITLGAAFTTEFSIGDYIRGTSAIGAPTLQIIGLETPQILFASNPAIYFAAGNNIWRLPATLEHHALTWDTESNNWIATPQAEPPLDILPWSNLSGGLYSVLPGSIVANVVATTNATSLGNTWTLNVTAIAGIPSLTYVVITDSHGRFATAKYVSAIDAPAVTAVLENVLVDRLAGGGWALGQTYYVQIREGVDAIGFYRGNGSTEYATQDNGGLYPGYLNNARRYAGTVEFTEVQIPAATIGPTSFTGLVAGTPALKFAVNDPVYIEEINGAWSITEAYVTAISGTADPTAIYTILPSGQFNGRENLSLGTYGIIVTHLLPGGVGTVNNLGKNITIAAGTNIGINTSGQTITINSNGGGGSASTIYTQPITPEFSAVPVGWAAGGRGYLFVPLGEENTGGIIQGITYIDAATTLNTDGFGMQMQTSIGGTATPYSDLTFRIAFPTLNDVVINVDNSAGIVDLMLQVVLVNRAVIGTFDAYARQYQHPLTTPATGDGTALTPIHVGSATGFTILSGTQIRVNTITGVLWDRTVPPNTAYSGVATRWIPVLVVTSGPTSPEFAVTGIASIGSVGGDGSIEVDLELGALGVAPGTQSLAQVLAVGNTTGNTNLLFNSTGKLSGPVTGLNIAGGTAGQVLSTDGAGNQSWVNGGGGSGTSIPVLNFTSSATPSAGQTFTNALLASYTSADQLTVSVNGATLNRSNYSLAGTVLTISSYLLASSAVQVQPMNAGGGGGGGGGTSVPVINFTSSATPSAGQAFTNVALATYTNANQLSITVNGSTLSSDRYTLAGSVLTITAYLIASSAVQVQPANAGGSGGNSGVAQVWSETGYHISNNNHPTFTFQVIHYATKTLAQVNADFPPGAIITTSFQSEPAYSQYTVGTGGATDVGGGVFNIPVTTEPGNYYAGAGVSILRTSVNPLVLGDGIIYDQFNRYSANVDGTVVALNSDGQVSLAQQSATSGQQLTWNGTRWAPATFTVPTAQSSQALYTVSANLQGAATSAQGQFVNLITQRFNNLGLTLNFAAGSVGTPTSGATYRLDLQAYNKINTTIVNAEIFYSCNTITSTSSYVGYGNGVGISNPINVNNRTTDYIANSAVGYWAPASTSEVLYFNYYLDPLTASNMLNVQLQLTITRIS